MVYLFLADGFEEVEALAVVDILRRADIDVHTVSVSDTKTVTAAQKVPVVADCLLSDVALDKTDMLILPGGMPGTANLAKSEALLELIRKAWDGGKHISAICAAPTVLAKAGILKGKKVICYPGFENELGDAVVEDKLVVQDGKLLTSKGPGTAFLFGYAIVDILKGPLASEAIRKAMIFDWAEVPKGY